MAMHRAPGVIFQVKPPEVPDKLARMDVAAFVGFAASGPLDTPVAVEGEAYFREIFGEDQELAWDPAQGKMLHAHLGSAVRSFFRNGGRRCWVVRVAYKPVTNQFPVPSLAQIYDGNYQGAMLQARSPGSWSDELRVWTMLQSDVVGDGSWQMEEDGTSFLEIQQTSRMVIKGGDLLRLSLKEPGLALYLVVDTALPTHIPGQAHRRWRVNGRQFWFRTTGPAQLEQVQIRSLSPGAPAVAVLAQGYWRPPSAEGYLDALLIPASMAPVVGALLEVQRNDGSTGLLSVSEVRPVTGGTLEEWGPAASDPVQWALLLGHSAHWPLTLDEGRALASGKGSVERLTFTIGVEDSSGMTNEIASMGFTQIHPRSFGNLPTDTQLFQPLDERSPLPDGPDLADGLWREVIGPRFPLAALLPSDSIDPPVFLPIGMSRISWSTTGAVALPDPRPKLERDGLADFSLDLFLDPDLRDSPIETLSAEAFAKRHIRMEPLTGIHAVFGLEEATLLCVPDLVHTGWTALTPPPPMSTKPPVLSLGSGATADRVRLTWEAVDQALTYTIQEADDPAFRTELRTDYARDVSSDLLASVSLSPRYVRVRAENDGQIGPWSNTLHILFPRPDFVEKDPLPSPVLTIQPWGGDAHSLMWPGVAADSYSLQAAHEPEFLRPTSLYEGPDAADTVWLAGESKCYYRVRAHRGARFSAWSNTVTLDPLKEQPDLTIGWRVTPQGPETITDDLHKRAATHRALLRLCHARGDLFAVLSLPTHIQNHEVIMYHRALVTMIGGEEERILSYGALYHPWLWVETMPGERRLMPPDGPMMGLIASRSLQKGAWFPAANQKLVGVIDLHHTTPAHAWAPLQACQVNMITKEPGGVRVMTAQTLSQEGDLRAINVRRLLMLIRRLVLREAALLVFEPNDESFRRTTERRFERLLTDLFVHGAFAGATPGDSFQVALDPALNTPSAVEQGQVFIDLHVAPAHPLVFMTIRLEQSQGLAPTISEV